MLIDEILIPKRRIFPRGLVIIAVAGVLAAIAGVVLWRTVFSSTPVQKYVTAPVQRTELADTVAATGPIVAATAVPLNFKNSGKVAEIDVEVGDTVKAGQVLAKLDPSDLQFQMRQAQANLAAAQANYDKLVHGPSPADVETAKAAVDAASRQLSDAHSGQAAAQTLATKEVAQAQAGVTTAQTNLSLAQAALQSARDQEAKSLAADRTAVANAQKNLDAQKATAAANVPVIEHQLEKAKDEFWATQTSRDAICGRSKGADCAAANTSVAAAQSGVDTAAAQVDQGKKQGAQQIAQAQSQLDQAQAQLTSDQAKWNAAVASAQGQIRQAYDALMTARRSTDGTGAREAQAIQAARAQVDTATSAVQNAKASYDKTVSPPTQAEIDNAKAQVAAQQALVDIAQANLDSATLKAPSAGVVTAINGAVGQWLTGGSTSGAAASAASGANTSSTNNATNFISLTDLSHLQVQAQVNEADVGRLTVGQPVSFTVDAFPGQTFKGTVAVVQSLGTTSQNVVSYPVLMSVEPTQTKLLPGMTANVTVTVNRRPNVLVVPAAAISFAQAQMASGSQASLTASANGGPTVLVVDNAGKATVHPIQTGASNGQYTEVVSGLTAGQRVAVGVQGS